jgi:probable phosphoglycerate mutase
MPRADRSSTTRTERRPGGRRRAPTATTVLLVRHGTTPTTGKELPGRAPGLHLSDEGRRQAEDVAARIHALAHPPAADGASSDGQRARKGLPVAAVYASPLERTRETAAPIAEALGHDVRVDEGLVELDIGEWTGMELKAAIKRPEWATVQRYPSGFTFPGGESFLAMQARVLAALDRMRAAHPGQAVVAVSHADPIRAVVAHAMGSHLDMFQRVVVSPCSLTAIVFGAGGPTVLTVNATGPAAVLVPA